MEQKINIAEILKDCPKDIELDCLMYENVTLMKVDDDKDAIFPIKVFRSDGSLIDFTKYGQYSNMNDAKCVIFPKGKTTWEGFNPPCKFKDGDVCYVKTKTLFEYIFIFKVSENYDYDCTPSYVTLSAYDLYTDISSVCASDSINEIRLATEEEKAKLFKAIKDNGYKWNTETKTLEKLVEPRFKVGDRVKDKNNRVWFVVHVSEKHFDISRVPNAEGYFVPIDDQDEYELVPNKFDINTLKPFDKVLVRVNDTEKWIGDFYMRHDDTEKDFPFICISGFLSQCIPYEDNQHLLGTTNDCDEYYKTW